MTESQTFSLAELAEALPSINAVLKDDKSSGDKSSGSKNSTVAKNGFRAEKGLCEQPDVKQALEAYFQSPITSIEKIHGKKADIKIVFANGTVSTTQNKDGDGKGRGWSVDRRKVESFNDASLITLLKTLCLKQGTEKPSVAADISKTVLQRCMLGDNADEWPTYFTHSKSDKTTGKIVSLGICKTDVLIAFMVTQLFAVMLTKRTCVHLSPTIYLQRKGGGKKDHAPDNIQMKFRFTEALEKLYTPIYPQTILQ